MKTQVTLMTSATAPAADQTGTVLDGRFPAPNHTETTPDPNGGYPAGAGSSSGAAPAPLGSDSEQLVHDHLPLVGHLVRQLLGRVPAHVNRDDLVSAGMIALVTAARGFDPTRGTPFSRFASSRIRGALLDELRGLDWASRSVRTRARRLESVQQELTSALGRVPTANELAQTLGVSVDEVASVAEDVHRAVVLSLQGFAAGSAEDMVTEQSAGPEDQLLHREQLGYLRDAVAALPERLRIVITGYFLNERPMAEIAAELGVSESRVSQLRAEALVLMRDGLNAHLNPDMLDSPSRPGGCVARRREAYYAEIGARGDLRQRLSAMPDAGLPRSNTA
jgi:RNA polymerase sigma factor for flagellar operon FliA